MIERKDALAVGFDPSAAHLGGEKDVVGEDEEKQHNDNSATEEDVHGNKEKTKPISLLDVIIRLAKSPRALTAMFIVATTGYVSITCPNSSHSTNISHPIQFHRV